MSRADDEKKHDRNFHKHDNIIDRRRFTNAHHQQQRYNSDNNYGWQIEDGRDLRSVCQGNKRPARRR